MWFSAPYRVLGEIPCDTLIRTLRNLPESVWHAHADLKEKLAPGRLTQSIFLKNITGHDFRRKLAVGPLSDSDVRSYHSGVEALDAQIEALMPQLLAAFPPGGIVCRLQLASLKAGASIGLHYDSSDVLRLCHRVHLPLTTEPGVRFSLAHESFHFKSGEAIEINNRVVHGVEHQGSHDRVHLIVDYLAPEYNHGRWLSDQHTPFLHRTSLQPMAPTLIASSVIRGAQKHQSHGGIYTVDFNTGTIVQHLDWDHCEIDFQGRGWDRGLRGIALFGQEVWVLASDELYLFNRKFQQLASYRSSCLKHGHEMSIHNGKLYITSTGFDAVLCFDLAQRQFETGWKIRREGQLLNISPLNPSKPTAPSNTMHINQVKATADGIFISGKNFTRILHLRPETQSLGVFAQIPEGTHNAQPFAGGVIYNDTAQDRLAYVAPGASPRYIAVPQYKTEYLTHTEFGDALARQGFARGLYALNDDTVFVGSSPSTVSKMCLRTGQIEQVLRVSKDIRNAIHGLTLWSMN